MKINWQTKKLGEICKINTGKSNANEAVENGVYAFFDRSKIIKKSNRFLFNCEALIIPGEGAQFFPRYYSGKFDLHQRAYALFNFDKNIDIRFIEYYLIFNHKYFERVAVGATAKSLRLRHFQELEIPLPPLSEQKRIVGILDGVFADVGKAKGNAEKNLVNAKELFESYLQSVFENPGKDWMDKKIGNLGKLQTGTTPKTSEKENIGDFISFIKPADFKKDGSLNYENFGLSKVGSKKSRLIDKNSVLMVCIGATIGKTGFTEKQITCNQQINSLTLKGEYCFRFFYYAMITNKFQKSVIHNSGQATLPIINKTKWSNLTISFPESIEKQKQIVKKLDELSVQTKRLETIYQQKVDDLDELKKSVLKKAFAGEL